ncbi:MAG: channel TrkA-N, partial [Phenylobacterium sp.]|nr:channel TrkA-N [Phenylobacterium sp.]
PAAERSSSMHGLPEELLISFGMIGLMVVTHVIGLFTLVRLIRVHIEHFRTPWVTLDRLLVPLTMGTWLFFLHGLEVTAYAVVYQLVGATRSWDEALYLSAGSYSTAGWAGIRVPEAWRLTTALEALSGMLLVGWSTAFLFQTLHRILATEENHPLPEGAIAVEPEEETSDNVSPRDSGSGKAAPDATN